jgi:carbamoyl-phosphate synthase large subunit
MTLPTVTDRPNVLLSCAGRRNYLVEAFAAALRGRGRVLAADASPDAPALRHADEAFVVPPIEAPDAVDALIRLCRDNDVGLLLSLNDFELRLLADERERFLEIGTIPVVSSPTVVETCFDKLATAELLSSCGVRTARTFHSPEAAAAAVAERTVAFPLVVKPRWGSASVGVEVVADQRQLELAAAWLALKLEQRPEMGSRDRSDLRTVLIQEHLPGREYGVDVVNDLGGRYQATLARRKLAMRAGETDRAVTVPVEPFEVVSRRIADRLSHVGNLDCDMFLDGEDVAVLELNPRFGGGYPFSHAGGANLPAALLAWARGETADPAWLRQRPGVTSAKYDRLVSGDSAPVAAAR